MPAWSKPRPKPSMPEHNVAYRINNAHSHPFKMATSHAVSETRQRGHLVCGCRPRSCRECQIPICLESRHVDCRTGRTIPKIYWACRIEYISSVPFLPIRTTN